MPRAGNAASHTSDRLLAPAAVAICARHGCKHGPSLRALIRSRVSREAKAGQGREPCIGPLYLGKHVWRQVYGKHILHAPLPEERDQATSPRAHIQDPAARTQIRDCFHNLGHPLQSRGLGMSKIVFRQRSRNGPLASAAPAEEPAAQAKRALPACEPASAEYQCLISSVDVLHFSVAEVRH